MGRMLIRNMTRAKRKIHRNVLASCMACGLVVIAGISLYADRMGSPMHASVSDGGRRLQNGTALNASATDTCGAIAGEADPCDGNATGIPDVEPVPECFCTCPDRSPAEHRLAVKNSFDSYNQYQKSLGDDGIEVDFTDYGLYPVEAVHPCGGGAWAVYAVGMLYMFMGLAIVCDEYFVPALEEMVEVFGLSDDVAGATLMAAGGSAPELATSIMGTFVTTSNVGFGTIVGSAVFNVLFVIGMCAVFAKEVLVLTWWPLARDSTYYTIGLVTLMLFYGFITPGKITLIEAIILLSLYIGYVTVMKFNEQLHTKIDGILGNTKAQAVVPTADTGDNNSMRRGSATIDMAGKGGASAFRRPTRFRAGVLHLMYSSDQLSDNARVHIVAEIKGDVKATFKELDKDNSGFIDKSELGAMLSKLTTTAPTDADLNAALNSMDTDHDAKISLEEFTAWYLKSEQRVMADIRHHFNMIDTTGDGQIDRTEVRQVLSRISTDGSCSEAEVEDAFREFDKDQDNKISFVEFEAWYRTTMLWKKNMEAAENEEDNEPFELELPTDIQSGVTFLLTAPIVLPLYFTVPDVRRERFKTWFPLTWTLSILWIAVFTFFMVWWVSIIGDLIGIPPTIMGLTFLAAGTSIPDLITSVIVARQGHGDMAVSSSIGSNIFDILIGLPVPWLFHNLLCPAKSCGVCEIVVKGDPMALITSVALLIGMLIAVIVTIAACRWRMTTALGLTMFFLYIIFLLVSILMQGGGGAC